MEYKIERLGTAGTLACQFEHKGHRYSAQVDYVLLGGGTACMICPEDGFDELYTKGDVPLTKEGLLSCIDEFVRMKEESKKR